MKPKSKFIYFDTNILLNLYNYPFDITNSIINALENFCDNESDYDIIIPYRAYDEYQNNKYKVLNNKKDKNIEQINEHVKIIKDSIAFLENNKFAKSFNTSFQEILKTFNQQFDTFSNGINESLRVCNNELNKNNYHINDPINNFVENHKSKNNIKIVDKLKLLQLYEIRIKNNIGPGLKDARKPTERDPFARAGDFLIWNEMLEDAKNDCTKKIIFVTNESKKDFWDNFKENKFNAFLISEINEIKENVFRAYSFNDFLTSFIIDYLADDINTIGFLNGKMKLFNSIFKEKSFIKKIKNDLEISDSDLINILSTFLNKKITVEYNYEIEDFTFNTFKDTYITDFENLSSEEDLELDFDPLLESFNTNIDIKIKGRSEFSGYFHNKFNMSDIGYFDFEIICKLKLDYFINDDDVSLFDYNIISNSDLNITFFDIYEYYEE